jgi:hypothetical protein
VSKWRYAIESNTHSKPQGVCEPPAVGSRTCMANGLRSFAVIGLNINNMVAILLK